MHQFCSVAVVFVSINVLSVPVLFILKTYDVGFKAGEHYITVTVLDFNEVIYLWDRGPALYKAWQIVLFSSFERKQWVFELRKNNITHCLRWWENIELVDDDYKVPF